MTGRLARRAAGAAGLGLLASAFIYLALAVGGLHAPYWQLWLSCTALLVLFALLGARGDPAEPLRPVSLAEPETQQRPYRQMERWEWRLATTHGDPAWYARVVHPRLVTLVGQRLWQRHGVSLSRDPARAREVLGADLADFLAAPPATATPSPAELSRLTTRIEEI
ncbi:hypothetical protein JQS43_15640 [Natronosporangium hydrolyticum]|uniref:Uncharacterized protein n=1 Tax=Natronosporangium hydrolyticum TaxID=2811111 RepID=A0A895Y5T1_9ACTN|nr:hypothetical protein [Natronosporangium hydrolyticum]QSB13077.1 hypothetical protein JQS43_15640 [Natronosporangium hydrolyticum]